MTMVQACCRCFPFKTRYTMQQEFVCAELAIIELTTFAWFLLKQLTGWTPLHVACVQEHAAAVKLLLAAGADASVVDKVCGSWIYVKRNFARDKWLTCDTRERAARGQAPRLCQIQRKRRCKRDRTPSEWRRGTGGHKHGKITQGRTQERM